MNAWINPFRDVLRGLTLFLWLGLSACTSTPSSKQRLPDAGPTTLDVYEHHLAGPGGEMATSASVPLPRQRSAHAFQGITFQGTALLPNLRRQTTTAAALAQLQEDFQTVPNPSILGYVYPHFKAHLPVPGYYTVFNLYATHHTARLGEAVPAPQVLAPRVPAPQMPAPPRPTQP